MRYWMWWNDLVQGPFEVDELVTLKAFSEDLLICMEDREDWLPASRVADLSFALEQLRARKAMPVVPPPPPPKRPPTLTPLQGEFFGESQEQQPLLESEDGPKGPFAFRPVSSESELPASYLIGQATMPFHFVRQPGSPTGVVEMPMTMVLPLERPMEKPVEMPRVTFTPPPVIRESPIPKIEEEASPVISLELLQEKPSLAPSFEEPAVDARRLQWLPWILGVLVSLGILGSAGYWVMDRYSTRSAIAEANRLESPRSLATPPVIPAIAAGGSPDMAPQMVRNLATYGNSESYASNAARSGTANSPSRKAAEKTWISQTKRQVSSLVRTILSRLGWKTPVVVSAGSAIPASSEESAAASAGVRSTGQGSTTPPSEQAAQNSAFAHGSGSSSENSGSQSFLNRAISALRSGLGFVPVSRAVPASPALSGAEGGVTGGSATEMASGAEALTSYSGSSSTPARAAKSSRIHSGRKGNKTTTKKAIPGRHGAKGASTAGNRSSAKTPPLVSGEEGTAASAAAHHQSTVSEQGTEDKASAEARSSDEKKVSAPAQKKSDGGSDAVVPGQAAVLPGVTPAGVTPAAVSAGAVSETIPAVDVQPPASATPGKPDPWKGKQNDAIRLVMAKTLPKSKITIGQQAKALLQQMHEKELIHAAETGERLYLPDKMATSALQEEGSHYRVYLNFMASQANGERVQARSYQFLVDLARRSVRTEEATTQQDLLSQPAELTFKHNPMATDIDSILGGVDTYNKHKVQLIIVRKNRRNKEERSKMESAMNTAQAKIKRAVIYFRRTYTEKALQNIAKAYDFTELLKG